VVVAAGIRIEPHAWAAAGGDRRAGPAWAAAAIAEEWKDCVLAIAAGAGVGPVGVDSTPKRRRSSGRRWPAGPYCDRTAAARLG
jgi:hypothetical protein